MTVTSFLTILGMCVATYITRVSGYFIASKMTMTPRFKAALSCAPMAIIISIVVPTVIDGGLPEWLASAVVVALGLRKMNLIICLGAGILAINLFRHLF